MTALFAAARCASKSNSDMSELSTVGLATAAGYHGGMAHLPFTLDEAKAEAIRLATEFKQTIPRSEQHRLSHAIPADSAATSGKIPTDWLVVFTWQPPDAVVDGGELFVRANIEQQSAELRRNFS
jgi:hypothetical protein